MSLVVTSPAGTIRGRVDGDILRYTGIPYAHADRFERPRAVAPGTDIDATRPAPACPQYLYSDSVVMMPGSLRGLQTDEHCQNLSIHVPADADGPLPVVVWIHGGAYVTGAGDSAYHDPSTFVREQKVIWVNVTYRLGILGYLKHADGPANLGLMDQVAALQWVHRNIASFGGDPDNVTVAGESAGGDAVAHLMVADGARGTFRRVISQSPPLGLSLGRAPASAAMQRQFDRMDLTHLPIDQLLTKQERLIAAAARYRHVLMSFGVAYDESPLPSEEDADQLWREVAPEIDMFMGTNVRESAFYVPRRVGRTLTAVPGGSQVMEAWVRRTTRSVFADAVTDFMTRHVEAGGNGYRYELDWGPMSPHYRGAHTIDMPLLFGNDAWRSAKVMRDTQWEAVDHLGHHLRTMWGEFVRTGHIPEVHEEGFITIDRPPVRRTPELVNAG